MDERVLQFRVGVVVVAATIILVILVFLFGAWPRAQYEVRMAFTEAPGVTIDTPVRKNGVLIGRVSDVILRNPDEGGGVIVVARIDRKRTLLKKEAPRIGTASLLGDAVVEFVSTSSDDVTPIPQDGSYVAKGMVSRNPLDALSMVVNLQGDITGAITSIKTAGDEVGLLAKQFNRALGDDEDRFERIMAKSEAALDEMSKTMKGVDGFVGNANGFMTNANALVTDARSVVQASGGFVKNLDTFVTDTDQAVKDANRFINHLNAVFEDAPEDKLRKAINDLPDVFDRTKRTLETFERVGLRLESNLQNLEGLTKPLGERGPELVDNAANALRNVDELVSQLTQLGKAINNREGSLGKLVYEDDLYEQVGRVVDNVENMTRRIEPIVNDVRVFTNKLARDPRQLGVKGALDRRPSGVGLKSYPLLIDGEFEQW